MLNPTEPVAIYMEGASNLDIGKMGFGVLRYSPNPVVCVIDSVAEADDMQKLGRCDRPIPIVGTIEAAANLGARVVILGTAPPGGLIPVEWRPALDRTVELGMSLVNGLHDLLAPRYPNLKPGQWIWDVRIEPEGLGNGSALAAHLPMRRVLMIGTDMAVGKMTAGLEIVREARSRGLPAHFVATGQIGITVTGQGVPLDAVRVDFATGAIERETLAAADRLRQDPKSMIVIEGQGALIHPASTANLPLLRGSCPTHLVLCHRAGQTHLRRSADILIPNLNAYAKLYEDLGEACGTFARPRTVAVALNTAHLSDDEARAACAAIQSETGFVCVDPIRHGATALVDAFTS
jgi:uncharacterized NAD-dependent epimerase/dehydratase family protein